MPEQSRTQLQMMLVQQAGRDALPLSILSPSGPTGFLPFLRTVEQLCVDERLAPVVIYWSRHTAARLLPGGQRYRELMRDAFRVSIFSEDRADPPDEWCFLIESRGLSLIVYGQQTLDLPESDKFQCSGSMDPRIVSQAFNRLLGIWQVVDLAEANLLEDARTNLGPVDSATPYIQRIRAAWPVIKAPIQQNSILQPLGPIRNETLEKDVAGLFSESSKIQPIAISADEVDLFNFKEGGGGAQVPLAVGSFAPTAPILLDPQVTIAPVPSVLKGKTREPEKVNQENSVIDKKRSEPHTKKVASKRTSIDLTKPTAIDQELPEDELPAFPPAAQSIISEIIGQLRHSNDLSSILQFAIEALTQVTKADRGIIWQVVGDQLQVTNEYAASGHTCFAGNQLGSEESTAIVLEFLGRFPDDSGSQVITIPDTAHDTKLHKMSPTLSSLIELGDVRARLMAQLRSRGIFSGFLELQQCGKAREWRAYDAAVLQKVAEMLSVVVQQSFDQSKIEMDAREMKLINEIASLFRESRGQTSQESLVKSVMLVAEHMGFTHSQIYLYSAEEGVLAPQIQDRNNAPVELSTKDNPFVNVFESGRGKIVNAEYTRKGDPFFGRDMALVLPLVSEGERLGVIGLWQRLPNKPQFRPQDRELGLTIAGHLSNVIRADRAISQIRADRARAALINKVSNEIRQSLKEVDQIMHTLVTALQEHFGLALCVASLYDWQTQDFTNSKTAGDAQYETSFTGGSPDAIVPNLGEHVFMAMLDELKEGQTIYLPHDQLKKRLEGRNVQVEVPAHYKQATLVPLIHAGKFKAALCMITAARSTPFQDKDMKMVMDLADRVAVVVSHAELFAQVEQQAVTDPMTGLFNRRYFQEQLTKEIDRFQRFGHAFSFIIVDLDYLKKINDSLGHHFGDIAIKHIANVLKRNVRDVDTVGRFGGEEFVVLLPETDLQHAHMVADRICSAIREKQIEGIGTVTASLGLATFPNDAQDRDKLLELADQALYLAKHRGRNQVCSVALDLMPSIEHGASSGEATEKDYNRLKIDYVADALDLETVAEEGVLGVINKIVKAIDERDSYGNERSPRAYDYANRVAHALHLSKEHAEIISVAAVMSNLGKSAIPEEILRKEGPLTGEEMERVKEVPSVGAKLLESAKLLHKVASTIECYRENWDGSGYPKGLKGDEIPLESRIVALVDAYTAMTSDRPYRKRLRRQQAVEEVQAASGRRFDPRLVKIFLSVLAKEVK